MRVVTQRSNAIYCVHHGLVMELHIQRSKWFVEQISFKSGLERVNKLSLLHTKGWGVPKGRGCLGESPFSKIFQAAILVNWGGIDPPNGGAMVVRILVSILPDIVEHGHLVPCGWGAEFCIWSYAPRDVRTVLSTQCLYCQACAF